MIANYFFLSFFLSFFLPPFIHLISFSIFPYSNYLSSLSVFLCSILFSFSLPCSNSSFTTSVSRPNSPVRLGFYFLTNYAKFISFCTSYIIISRLSPYPPAKSSKMNLFYFYTSYTNSELLTVIFFFLLYNRRPKPKHDALAALRLMPRVGKV
jgi:hypothetical protein